MSYNDKKFLDVNGLKHLISILDDYPTNEVLGTVINAIESEIPTNVSQLQNDAGYLTTHQDISGKANSADLATVATSGDYDDLINKPTIPSVPVTDVQVNGTSILSDGIANVPLASSSNFGVAKTSGSYGVSITDKGVLKIDAAGANAIKLGTATSYPIVPSRQDQSTFYGLAKAAGADMKDIAITTVGTYPDAQKAAIQNMLGVTDLISTEEVSTATAAHALNSTFMMNGKLHRATAAIAIGDAVEVGTNCEVVKADEVFVKNTDLLTYEKPGLVKIPQGQTGLVLVSGQNLAINYAQSSTIKSGSTGNLPTFCPITPRYQHEAVFYGLAKAAGADEKDSTLSVGTYTETAKTAIRNMLGAASTNIVAVQDEQPTDTDTKVWLPGTQATGVEVPTYAEFQQGLAGKVSDVQVNGTSIVNNGTANIPLAALTGTPGVIGYVSSKGLNLTGGHLEVRPAYLEDIKTGTHEYFPLTPVRQHVAAFYGLAKAAGDTTQSVSDNAVGTYTADASAAIRSMLGAVGDVQIDGTSIISNGAANIPRASNGVFGLVRIAGSDGVAMANNGDLYIDGASDSSIKNGTNRYKPIAPLTQHISTFYGLAKAAGDTTMSSSSNAVGTYTAEAKSAIQSMLGIDLQSIASEVEIPLVETVSGTTPTITGQPNTRYVCGEVSTLSITPPSAGSIDVIFDSGSTPAVITVPNTVKWPAWFDVTALEADTTYEILITDEVYGSVMTWAN